MKRNNMIVLVVLFVGTYLTAWAQPTNAPVFDPNTAPLPVTKSQFWTWGISVVAPVLIWALSKVPKIPKAFLPTAAPFVGVLLGFVLTKLQATSMAWYDAAAAGSAGVMVREIFNQWITKQMVSNPLDAQTSAVELPKPASKGRTGTPLKGGE